MEKFKIYKMKTLFLIFCILAGIAFPTVFSILNISNSNLSSIENSDDTFIYSLNGKNYLAKYITENDLNDLKKQGEVREKHSDYNIIIDGHGTGFVPPTEKDSEKLIGEIKILEVLEDNNPHGLKASHDLSTEIYFPVVGDQQSQGSCAAWASVYYAYGYLEAKDYGWNAKSGDPDYLMSPAWTYNKVAAYDSGSWMTENGQILQEWGGATMSTMPYDDSDVNSWGNETAWREAPYHRAIGAYLLDFNESNPTTTIDMIKTLVQGGTPVTFALDAYQFYTGLEDNYIISSAEYESYDINHAQCIVGFDDSITEDGDSGAFRVVNSWGEDFYLMDGGFYWLTYDTLIEIGMTMGDWYIHLCIIEDIADHLPNLIATWEFNPAPTRMGDIVTLGVGPHDTPLDSKTPWYEYDDGYIFPDFMAFDISDFLPYYNANNSEFFFLDIGSSITTGIISSFLIERYTAGVLVETTYESIDVPQSTPGYVRNTFMDFDHEITVSLEVPENPEIFETYLISATVQNIGINDESNVELYLYLDGIVVNSSTYSTLSAGASETIDYVWKPMVYDTFNFTVFSPPVAGEYTEENNFKYSLLTIKLLQNYTMTVGYPYMWINTSGGTELFLEGNDWAEIPLPFNFTLYDQTFSTVYLCSNGYLSFYDTMPMQGYNIPFPSGDPSHYYMIAPFWDDLDLPGGGHIYIQSFGTYWVAEWQDICHSDGEIIGSFQVVLNETGEIIFNYDYLDYMDPYNGYTCGLNLGVYTECYNYYQGLTDSTDDLSILFYLESVEHDLRVTLDTPSAPELGTSYIITAMVQNYGEHNESDIDFYLYYDEVLVNSTFIPYLQRGEKAFLTYNWTPTTYRTYNLTAYAPPVINETYVFNNRVVRLIKIREVKLFDGMFIDHTYKEFLGGFFYRTGPSRVSYSHISGSMFHVDWQITIDGIMYQGYWDVDGRTRIMENCGGGAYFGNGFHSPFWIFQDSSLGDIIPIAVDAEGDHNFNITGDFLYDLPGFGLIDVWILEDLTLPGGMAWYEKSSGILLYGNFSYFLGKFNYIFDLVDTNVTFEYIIFDHDLKVYLETPILNKIDETYVINATVKNVGLNDETNVELFLYLDEILIDSITIPTLTVGMEQTIQYIWTPTEYGTYNFTAYAPPVPLESYVENNRKTTFVYLFETKLFDGLYIKHIFSAMGYTNFSYTAYTSRLYKESFGMEYMGITMSFTWIVDALTRMMSGGSIFANGAHTPAWIFTNTSLYEIIPIAVPVEGDHNFYVARELVYDLPGFGLVEVWELEDLTLPGGIAWYEKSTGILLNGTFFYGGGADNYTFDFIDTNADMKILSPFTVISPDNSSSWETYSSHYINWTSIVPISDVKLELYKDGVFVMDIVSSTANDGEFYWTIPSGLIDSDQYQIKITDVSNPSTYAYSDYFEIYTPSISITTPDSTSSWETGSSYYIYWTSTGTISNVKIELYKDDVFVMEIISSTPNDGEYYWTVPSELDDSTQYQIIISDASNPSIYDDSEYFEIKTAPQDFTLLAIILSIVGGAAVVVIISVIILKKRRK